MLTKVVEALRRCHQEARCRWADLNSVDDTGSIKFTAEQEQNEQMPFIDTLIVRKADGRVKLLVYRKKIHTDQYLHIVFVLYAFVLIYRITVH